MAVHVVAGGRLSIHQAIRGIVGLPPSTDEMARGTIVDTPVNRTTEGGVSVVASRRRSTNRGVGSRRAKDEVDGSYEQGGDDKSEPGEEVSSIGVDWASNDTAGSLDESRHCARTPTRRAPSVSTM